jgi:hypothetical protein
MSEEISLRNLCSRSQMIVQVVVPGIIHLTMMSGEND